MSILIKQKSKPTEYLKLEDETIKTRKNGFSLVELLVVISIIAVIVALAMPNFLGARQRTRDAKKKSELVELKNALRLYYNDYQSYPVGNSGEIVGCGAGGAGACPCVNGSTEIDFASGASCDVVYMKRFPKDTNDDNAFMYYRDPIGEDFWLVVALDNASDSDIQASHDKCNTFLGAPALNNTDYVQCAD